MLRNRAVALILCWLASPFAYGLGLGPLHATSGLNEPFEGRIEILAATAEDFDALTIGLAGTDHFERAGIDRAPVLFQLRFTIDDSAAEKNYITVSSEDPIREPFLNFLLEVNWSNGRLLREYTVLLDPPIYDPHRRSAEPTPSPAIDAPLEIPEPAPVAVPETPTETFETPSDLQAPDVIEPSEDYVAGNEIGPMIATDTLWSIATARRPDESVSVQQMMLALLQENPDAFSDGNINMLRRGAILRLPDQASVGTVATGDAFAEVKRQNQIWEEYRLQLGLAPTAQPLGAPAAGPPPDVTPEPQVDARLELLAPGADETGGEPGQAGTGPGTELLREELDAQAQLNVDLDDKLTEAEEIIDLLQRQVNIQDEELAGLQARLAELGIEHGDIGVSDVPVEEPAPVEPDPFAVVDPEVEPEPEVIAEPEVVPEPEVEPEPEVALEPEVEDEAAPEIAIEDEVDAEAVVEVPAAEVPVDEQELVDTEPEDIIEMDTGPPTEAGFPQNLIPEHIASMVPGGALTILGAVLAILVLFVVVVQFLLKSRGGRRVAPAAVTAPPMPEPEPDDATEEPEITAEVEDEDEDNDSEAITAVGDEEESVEFDPDSTKEEFDPDATVDARADAEPADAESTVAQAGAASEAAAAPVEEEDPLEEVNVYLAYERFDQAEELVKRVIGEYPDRHEYKLRLLEVYYSSNDKGAYETAARELNDAVGESDPLWESAVAMWSEMAPERALFEEGAEAEAADEAPDQEAAKAFVDITGDSDEEEAGADTMVMAPGSDDDEGLDFDIGAEEDAPADDGILDLTASADDDGGMLDLTVADTGDDDAALDISGGDEAEGVLDITDGGDAGVLDITEGGADTGDDLLDLTGGGDTDGIMDITAIDDDAVDSSDLLDVTKTGDISGVEDGDLLNVTSPGLNADDELDVSADAGDDDGLEITESGAEDADDEGLDFDISDTVAPAFDLDADAEAERVLDLTDAGDADSSDSDVGGGEGDPLEFDIGGLDTEDEAGGEELGDLTADEAPTVDLDSALEAVQEEADADVGDELDFDITMGEADLDGALDVEETDVVDEGLEITMSSDQGLPADTGLDLEIQEEDEISIDDAADLNVEEDDFNFSLENTAEMDGIAADDTLDMAQSDTGGPDTLDIGDDASLDDLTMELDAAMDDVSLDGSDDGELDLDIEAVTDGGDDDGHLETVKLEDETPELVEDSSEKTVVMPRSPDETQSDADEADTKLNLAKAYIELGDTDGARSILDEVVADGNDAQKAEAQALLDQLSG